MGMSTTTGRTLRGRDELRQGLRDLLTTRIGTRVLNRTYGCRIWDFVDGPLNPATSLAMAGAVAEAVAQWLPAIKTQRVTVTGDAEGRAVVTLYGVVDGARFEESVSL